MLNFIWFAICFAMFTAFGLYAFIPVGIVIGLVSLLKAKCERDYQKDYMKRHPLSCECKDCRL